MTLKGCVMKKLTFSILFFTSFSNVALANILDVSRLSDKGEFSVSFGAGFKSGLNKEGTSETDLVAGTIKELGLELDYSFTDDLSVSFSTDNSYSDSQIGIDYKILKNFPLKLHFFSDYGIAWTKNAKTDERIGQNNLDAGFRLHGIAWEDFQWAIKLSAQYVFADTGNFWNFGTALEAMYYFRKNIATKLEFEYTFENVNEPVVIYDRSVSLGVIYNMSEMAAVHPYIKYHFKTANSENDVLQPDDFWKFGLKFSVEF